MRRRESMYCGWRCSRRRSNRSDTVRERGRGGSMLRTSVEFIIGSMVSRLFHIIWANALSLWSAVATGNCSSDLGFRREEELLVWLRTLYRGTEQSNGVPGDLWYRSPGC